MMRTLRAAPVHKQTPTNTHVSPILKSCTHVFVRHDAVRKSLKKPYDGPYKVQKYSEKHYTVDINGHDEAISIDCLKPAFHEQNQRYIAYQLFTYSRVHYSPLNQTESHVMVVKSTGPSAFLQ